MSWDVTWGDSEQIKLPEFDVCWTSPPYELDPNRITQRLWKVATSDSLLWIMHPDLGRIYNGWDLLTRCTWCMTESEVDKSYHARQPLEVMHDIGLFRKRNQEHYWAPDYWMPNWIAGGDLPNPDAEYLTVPQEVIGECLGASLPGEGKTFLDPFCGTGTSVLTAHEMGFRAVGVEINEETCKQARMRLKAMGFQLPSERHEKVVYEA